MKWAERQAERLTLSETVYLRLERGLTVREDSRFGNKQRQRAREMAGDAIDHMGDATTTADDRAARPPVVGSDNLSTTGTYCNAPHRRLEMIRRSSDTRALGEANKAFKKPEPQTAMNEYERAQQSFHENRERLKAERLAREGKPRENCR
jgi:hypothetical protein